MISEPPAHEVSEAPADSRPDSKKDTQGREPAHRETPDRTAPPPAPPETGEPHRRRPWLLIGSVVVIAAFLFFHFHNRKAATAGADGQGGKGGKGGQGAPVPVVAATAATKDVGVYLNGLGTVTALNTVTVQEPRRRPAHEGRVHRRADRQRRATCWPRSIRGRSRCSSTQAEGQLAKDQAALQNAQARPRALQGPGRAGLDPAAAARHAGCDRRRRSKAPIKTDQAADRQREAATRPTPASPRRSPAASACGWWTRATSCTPTDANGLVVITQLQPIAVVFTHSRGQPAAGAATDARRRARCRVEAYDRDLKTQLATGTLLTIDNQIDPTTGTVQLKAVFANEDNALFPNQFVNARLLVDTQRRRGHRPDGGGPAQPAVDVRLRGQAGPDGRGAHGRRSA